jgi:hypothetical protein
LYDVGPNYLVMEYIDGQPVRAPIAVEEAVKYAIHVADALETAHAKGIIHRDIKPANVIITGRGEAKVLDFGLAQFDADPSGSGCGTEVMITAAGSVVGTVAYMSPEQARGQGVDGRTDIWALGVMLYEMVTGVRPFQGATQASVFDALLNSEPISPSLLNVNVPAELEHLIRKAIEKDRALRYQTAGDLLVDLRRLRRDATASTSLGGTVPAVEYRVAAEVSPAPEPEPPPLTAPAGLSRQPGRSRLLLVRGAATVALVAIFGVSARFLLRSPPEQGTNEPVAFTTYPGSELSPSFSPDGNQITFTWNGASEKNFDIYVKTIGAEAPLRLTTAEEADAAPRWSPDGRTIAFERVLHGPGVALMLIPPLGGPERKLAEFDVHGRGWGTSWSPDGKWLAVCGDFEHKSFDRIYLLSVESGDSRPLTAPPAGGMGDSDPALSPDGDALAFVRWVDASATDLYVLNLGRDSSPRGEPKKLPVGNLRPFAPAWTAGGRQIVFVSGVSRDVYRISATGGSPPERIGALGRGVTTVALTRDGRRLAYSVTTSNSNIWRLDLTVKDAAPERFIASTKREVLPQYPPGRTAHRIFLRPFGDQSNLGVRCRRLESRPDHILSPGCYRGAAVVAGRAHHRVRLHCHRDLSGLYNRSRGRKSPSDDAHRRIELRGHLVARRPLDLLCVRLRCKCAGLEDALPGWRARAGDAQRRNGSAGIGGRKDTVLRQARYCDGPGFALEDTCGRRA